MLKNQYLRDYQPSAYSILGVEMDLEFTPEIMRVASVLRIEKRADTPSGATLELDGEELELDSIEIDGVVLAPAQYTYQENRLVILNPPEGPFELRSQVNIRPEANTQLMGLYRSSGVWCTQCEPEGFRRISFMADRPDVMTTYKVRLTADKALAPVLLANGNLVQSGDLAGGKHFTVWEDPHPKPTYLFAAVAGKLDVLRDEYTTLSGQKIDLAIYCEPGKAQKCLYAMDALKRAMAWDEQRFGRVYDLEVFNIVAVSDFNFGAMENKGLNIFNDKFILADPDSATDMDYYNIERIVAHEYFHNWTGNRITCRDWFQLCLKEGLTVYRDQEFTSDMRSRAVKRIGDARSLRASQFPEDAGPLAHPPRPDHYAEINNFYTATVYNKGAEIVRMLASILGEEGFSKGCDLYFERHDGEATTIESWIKVFEDSSGRNLSQFTKWYTQAGTPQVQVKESWDEDEHHYTLKLTQINKATPGQAKKDPMYIPLKFGLVGPNGQDLMWEKVTGGKVHNDMIILDGSEMELTFEGVAHKPILSLLREFSAPVVITGDQSAKDQLFLGGHDSDPFNRWQALQDVAITMMVEAVGTDDGFDDLELQNLAEALRETLESDALDNSFKALALSLPGEASLAQAIGNDVDPGKIHRTRKSLLGEISRRLNEALTQQYAALKTDKAYRQSADQVAARSLKNQCLALLVAQESAMMDALAQEQYLEANNMSDRMGALGAMVGRDSPVAEKMLAHFRAEFCSDMLIFDKWLALIAHADNEKSVERIREIYHAPGFPKTNPNRLKSLVGAFTMGNSAQFTRLDGSGFRFAAQVAMEIDEVNPQVAASIMTAFRMWRTWEPNRKALAGEILQNLAEQPGKSADLTDIITRTLAG